MEILRPEAHRAQGAVFRPKKPVAMLRWLERMQTGHAGDYVAWITVGCALLGAVFWAAVR
jgi:hypothetical protein